MKFPLQVKLSRCNFQLRLVAMKKGLLLASPFLLCLLYGNAILKFVPIKIVISLLCEILGIGCRITNVGLRPPRFVLPIRDKSCPIPSACIGKSDGRKVGAKNERPLADACYTMWNGDGCKTGPTRERPIADACHAIGNRDARKPCAIRERRLADACYIIWNGDACKAGAFTKRTIAYDFCIFMNITTCDRFRCCLYQNNIRICFISEIRRIVIAVILQTGAIIERSGSDACHAIWNRDARKAFATGERPIADACHAIWNDDARKAVAIFERRGSDACHAIWNDDARKAVAIFERRLADACHAIRKGDARKAFATGERIRADACHAIRNDKIRYKFTAKIEIMCIT